MIRPPVGAGQYVGLQGHPRISDVNKKSAKLIEKCCRTLLLYKGSTALHIPGTWYTTMIPGYRTAIFFWNNSHSLSVGITYNTSIYYILQYQV